MSYLIRNGRPFARTADHLKSGSTVRYAHDACIESINASRGRNLVNAHEAKISNAKRWSTVQGLYYAQRVNEGEYLVGID